MSSSDLLALHILESLRDGCDRPCLHVYGIDGTYETFSFDAVRRRAESWTQTFVTCRLTPRSRVLIVLDHSLDLYASFVGALLGNYIPSILSPPSPKQAREDYFSTLTQLVAQAGATGIVTTQALENQLRPTLSAAAPASLILTSPSASSTPLPFDAPSAVSVHDTAFVQYSSGTTGLKKGVAITSKSVLWQLDQYAAAIGLTKDDVVANWLPLYHDMGLVTGMLLPLVAGIPVAAMSALDWVRRPVLLLEAITTHCATLCWLPNFAFSFLAKTTRDDDLNRIDLDSLRAAVSCAEAIMPESLDGFVNRFAPCGLRRTALKSSYAMAENTFAVTSGGFEKPIVIDVVHRDSLASGLPQSVEDAHPLARRVVSSGTPLPETDIQILSEASESVPERHVGEIAIKSPCLFERHEGSSSSALIEGWFRTGDLGYVADGELFVIGRKKDVIIVAGKNIYPEDLEEAVNRVTGVVPGRSVAFGVTDSDKGTEQVVVVAETHETQAGALAQIAQGIRLQVTFRTDVVVDAVRLVPHMWLRKSSSGKLSRATNRRRYLAELLPSPTESMNTVPGETIESPSAPDTVNTWLTVSMHCVRRVLRNRLPSGFGPDDDLIRSGLIDSFAIVALVLELENASGLRFPKTFIDVGNFHTARDMANLLRLASTGEQCTAAVEKVNGVSETDDRGKVCQHIVELTEPIDLIILGSSRAKQMSPAIPERYGLSTFNAWFSNARAEDWYCVFRFILDYAPAPPRAVVLLVDVQGFANDADLDARLACSSTLTKYLRPSDAWSTPLGRKGRHPHLSDRRFDSVLHQLRIGKIDPVVLGLRYKARTPRTAGLTDEEERAPLQLRNLRDREGASLLQMRGFTELDRRRLWYLRELLTSCVAREISVVCALSPQHPHLDALLTQHTAYADRLAELIEFFRQFDHPLVGFHDTRVPAQFGGWDEDFVDANHMGLANSDKLLEYLLRRLPMPADTTTQHRQDATDDGL